MSYDVPQPYNADVFYASEWGVLPASTAAQNSARLQTLIDHANSNRSGGRVVIERPGTYSFAATGSTVTRPGASTSSKSCVQLKTKVDLIGGVSGITLQIGDGQCTNAVRCHLFRGDPGLNNVTIANLKLKGNTAGQTGYTGGYTQGDDGGTLLAIGDSSGSAYTTSTIRFYNLVLEDVFGAAADMVYLKDALAENVSVDNCGEGFQINGYANARVFSYTYRNTNTVSVGDSLELVNGTDLLLDGFDIVGSAGGSALDITGRNVRVLNGSIRNGGLGVVLQYDAAQATEPNSDNWLISNVTVKSMTDQAFNLAGGSNGNFRGTISNCRAESCQTGFLISNPTGSSEVYVTNCVATNNTVAGLCILAIDKIIVRGGQFDNQATGAYGIMLANRTGADKLICDIEGARAVGNARFGVYVEDNTHYPKGRVVVNAKGNSTGDMSYFDGLDGRTYANKDFYLYNSAKTGLELINLKTDETSGEVNTRVVTGLERIRWDNIKLRQLQGGCDKQRIEILFSVITTVEAVATTANNNILLYTDDDGDQHFDIGDTLVLQYNATTAQWDEVTRRHSYVLPFAPNQVIGFRSWYKEDFGLWQDSGKTTAAGSAGDRVYVWEAYQGTALDLTTNNNTNRPARHASGGIVGDGTSRYLSASISLPGPFTVVMNLTSAAAFTLNRFLSVAHGTGNWSVSGSNSSANTVQFYEAPSDPAALALSTTASTQQTVAVGVASDGTTTLYTSAGTLTTAPTTTTHSVSSTLELLALTSGGNYGVGPLHNVVLYTAVISQNDFTQLRQFFQ